MARAVSTQKDEETGHGFMFLAIDVIVWELLKRQAAKEKSQPGEVLSRAVGQYLASHGDKETLEILEQVRRS